MSSISAKTQFIVPLARSGGVYDFAKSLQGELGQNKISLIALSKENVHEWIVQSDEGVILQYSGYGFANRGAPLWLLRHVTRRRSKMRFFGVQFHELYATGSPASSAFWLSPLQRYISKELAQLSDFYTTNREASLNWLGRAARTGLKISLPVFSNIGELSALPKQRCRQVVVFGSAPVREQTYRHAGLPLFRWIKQHGLELHDIGPPVTDSHISRQLAVMQVVEHGYLRKDEIGRILKDSALGIVAYPSNFASKSGVFAAYCAHGVCPILLSTSKTASDGLRSGVHYIDLNQAQSISMTDSMNVGSNAWQWYQKHTIKRHAQQVQELINKCGGQIPD